MMKPSGVLASLAGIRAPPCEQAYGISSGKAFHVKKDRRGPWGYIGMLGRRGVEAGRRRS